MRSRSYDWSYRCENIICDNSLLVVGGALHRFEFESVRRAHAKSLNCLWLLTRKRCSDKFAHVHGMNTTPCCVSGFSRPTKKTTERVNVWRADNNDVLLRRKCCSIMQYLMWRRCVAGTGVIKTHTHKKLCPTIVDVRAIVCADCVLLERSLFLVYYANILWFTENVCCTI